MEKRLSQVEITLVGGEEIVSSEIKVADTLNTFIENAVSSLGIPQIDDFLTDFSNTNDPIENIIKTFSKHP